MEVTHIFSKKQLKLLKLFKNGGLKRINILEGSVRSGKTYISLIIWALFVACGEKNASYLMCAKTLTGLRRNVLDALRQKSISRGRKRFESRGENPGTHAERCVL